MEEVEELVQGCDFDGRGDGVVREVHGEVLVVDADEPVGEEGGRGGAAGDEAVVVGGEGGGVQVRQNVG